jgi:ubiquinone/menaquinone biosynthesis C-methylase UbiE
VDAIKSGGALSRAPAIPDVATWVGFAHFMSGMAKPVAEAAATALASKNRNLQVLDIAAGSGVYGLAVAAWNSKTHVFALDTPEVLDVARVNADRAGMAARYHLIPGDAFEADFGGPYDLILMANFAHHFDSATNVALFKKCRNALTSSGRLALIDFVPNDDRVSPGPDAAFALTMLATTASGDAYTFREFRRMLRDAGFATISRPDLGEAPRWLIVAS